MISFEIELALARQSSSWNAVGLDLGTRLGSDVGGMVTEGGGGHPVSKQARVHKCHGAKDSLGGDTSERFERIEQRHVHFYHKMMHEVKV